jgi:hypothetical protein
LQPLVFILIVSDSPHVHALPYHFHERSRHKRRSENVFAILSIFLRPIAHPVLQVLSTRDSGDVALLDAATAGL